MRLKLFGWIGQAKWGNCEEVLEMLPGALELPCDAIIKKAEEDARKRIREVTARRMKKGGLTVEEIVEFTELSAEEVEAL